MSKLSEGGWTSSIEREFSGANFGDARLEKRLSLIAEQISLKPAESFPGIFPEESQREAFYRFLRNSEVGWKKILEPHFGQTRRRAIGADEVIAIHDSSKLQFQRKSRGDLGFISQGKKGDKINTAGFVCHFSLAVSGTTNPQPLGVLNVRPLRRFHKTKNTAKQRTKAQGPKSRERFESSKWLDGVKESRRRLSGVTKVIHVMDPEADYFALMAELVNCSERFVIRVSHEPRKVRTENGISTISQTLVGRPVTCEREVFISKRMVPRVGTPSKSHVDRPSRRALLSISTVSVNLKRPPSAVASAYPKDLSLNIVHIYEENPPQSQAPVDWKLLTTEPIDTEEQILKIVDVYRARWTIEEFF